MSKGLALTVALMLLASAASAQTVDPDRLNDLSDAQATEQAREAKLRANRDAVKSEIRTLKSQLVKAASEAAKYEKAAQDIERRLTQLQADETRLKTAIYGDRKTLMRLMGALQRIDSNPPPALAVTPHDAAEAARAARLMSSLAKDLEARAEKLTAELTRLNDLRTEIGTEQEKLEANEAALETRRKNIKRLVRQKSKLESSISADQTAARARMAALAAEADTLRELISTFERSTRGVTPRLKPPVGAPEPAAKSRPRSSQPAAPLTLPPNTKRFAVAGSAVRAPVQGTLKGSYSKKSKGMTITTRDKAQVVAPYAGRVEFAGPFKSYENVVILNVGGGYFILLTGLGEIYAEAEDMVTPGQPLGLMPFNTQGGAELYIEIRKNGSPVNPAPWLGTAFARNG